MDEGVWFGSCAQHEANNEIQQLIAMYYKNYHKFKNWPDVVTHNHNPKIWRLGQEFEVSLDYSETLVPKIKMK